MLQPKYYAIVTVIDNNKITIESVCHSNVFNTISSNLTYSGIKVVESHSNIGSHTTVWYNTTYDTLDVLNEIHSILSVLTGDVLLYKREGGYTASTPNTLFGIA